MNIILIGFKNCGKSTVGRALADKFHCQFVDTDDSLKKLYTAETKKELSIQEIYKIEGEENFRTWESRVLENIKEIDHAIISTGGGMVMNEKNAATLKKLGKIIYLEASEEELLQRQKKTRVPEFLNTKDPLESFKKMYLKRKPVYEKVADHITFVDDKHAPTVVNDITSWIEHQ